MTENMPSSAPEPANNENALPFGLPPRGSEGWRDWMGPIQAAMPRTGFDPDDPVYQGLTAIVGSIRAVDHINGQAQASFDRSVVSNKEVVAAVGAKSLAEHKALLDAFARQQATSNTAQTQSVTAAASEAVQEGLRLRGPLLNLKAVIVCVLGMCLSLAFAAAVAYRSGEAHAAETFRASEQRLQAAFRIHPDDAALWTRLIEINRIGRAHYLCTSGQARVRYIDERRLCEMPLFID